MNRRVLATFLLLSGQFAAVPATTAAAQTATSISQFDVAGVRLGMTPAQARAALLQNGYKVTEDRYVTNQTWEELIQSALASRLKNYTARESRTGGRNLEANKDPRQTIKVTFLATPRGMRVENVEYRIPAGDITKADFDANVARKYGEPTRRVSWAALWCSPGEKTCIPNRYFEYPSLKSRHNAAPDFRSVELDGTNKVERARFKALIAAEVERRAPRTRVTAF